MAKKKNRSPMTPPLSFLDRCIYYLGYVLLFAFLLAFLFCPILLFDFYVFSDPEVIAGAERAGLLLLLPFLLYTSLSGFIGINTWHSERKPIFGNSNVNYKDPRWERVSPLLSKEKVHSHIEQRPSRISFRKKMWRIWLTGFVIVTMLLPFSFFGRRTYDCNGIFHRYNCVNQETASYSVENVKSLTISVTKSHKGRNFGVCFTFRMEDGEKFSFDIGDFRGNRGDSLEEMLRLKSKIPMVKISYDDLHRMEQLLYQYRSDPYCTELVNRIFDLQEGSEADP